jgi:hypothetical protein
MTPMKQNRPPPTTSDSERKALCDLTIERAAELMLEAGAPIEMVIDRLSTFTVGRMVATSGKGQTSLVLRGIADRVDAGIFDHVDPTSRRH